MDSDYRDQETRDLAGVGRRNLRDVIVQFHLVGGDIKGIFQYQRQERLHIKLRSSERDVSVLGSLQCCVLANLLIRNELSQILDKIVVSHQSLEMVRDCRTIRIDLGIMISSYSRR